MLIVLVLVLTAMWRVGWAKGQVAEAAAAGARAATVSKSLADANRQAESTVEYDLSTVNLHCADMQTTLDASAFLLPPGEHARVVVTVVCEVDLADLLVPGMPGSVHAEAQASEVLDVLRERKP